MPGDSIPACIQRAKQIAHEVFAACAPEVIDQEGHLNPVHPKTNKQIPMIYQLLSDTPIRLSNVVKLDYSMSVQQNYQRMENKKWFYMSIFELLAKREESINDNLQHNVAQTAPNQPIPLAR